MIMPVGLIVADFYADMRYAKSRMVQQLVNVMALGICQVSLLKLSLYGESWARFW